MKRIGYQLENVSLHYRGNQGLDLIFRTASGELAIVTTPTYAVVEAKHGKGLESLSKDSLGRVQGSRDYNQNRLEEYIREGDDSHRNLAKKLHALFIAHKLKSYATFYGGNSIYELTSSNDGKKVNAIRVP